jgi:hypothetical protein
MDDLTIPDFLRGSREGPKPRWTTPWKRMVAQRPDCIKWDNAERWEVTIPKTMTGAGQPAFGTRYVWVIPGRKWTEIRDAEGYAKIATADWNRMSAKGRKVS